MNLNKDHIQELNKLLKDPELKLPPFRREVTATGANYQWLQKHIQVKNKNVDPRVLELLALT